MENMSFIVYYGGRAVSRVVDSNCYYIALPY